MKPHGLIADEWVLSYAAGALGEAHELLVASHISYHDDLKARVAEAEAVGGLLLESLPEAAVPDDSFDKLLARLDAPTPAPTPAPQPQKLADSKLPAPLAAYLGKGLDDLKWRAMGPGLRQARLWTGDRGEKLWLLKARGGTAIPEHSHGGLEMTLILTGGYRSEAGQFGPGDLDMMDETTGSHTPVIDEGEDCICLVVMEAPIKPKSLIARLVQPFIGL